MCKYPYRGRVDERRPLMLYFIHAFSLFVVSACEFLRSLYDSALTGSNWFDSKMVLCFGNNYNTVCI